jgi:hypothetical protein
MEDAAAATTRNASSYHAHILSVVLFVLACVSACMIHGLRNLRQCTNPAGSVPAVPVFYSRWRMLQWLHQHNTALD